jgi:hypothetical protein
MEQNPSWEADICSACLEIPGRLWNLNVHYRVDKSLALVPTMNESQYMCILIFPFHLHLNISK